MTIRRCGDEERRRSERERDEYNAVRISGATEKTTAGVSKSSGVDRAAAVCGVVLVLVLQ